MNQILPVICTVLFTVYLFWFGTHTQPAWHHYAGTGIGSTVLFGGFMLGLFEGRR